MIDRTTLALAAYATAFVLIAHGGWTRTAGIAIAVIGALWFVVKVARHPYWHDPDLESVGEHQRRMEALR